jgi:hypothetical protein
MISYAKCQHCIKIDEDQDFMFDAAEHRSFVILLCVFLWNAKRGKHNYNEFRQSSVREQSSGGSQVKEPDQERK